jgi:hypothetical protein
MTLDLFPAHGLDPDSVMYLPPTIGLYRVPGKNVENMEINTGERNHSNGNLFFFIDQGSERVFQCQYVNNNAIRSSDFNVP